jgi:hypothetical protein
VPRLIRLLKQDTAYRAHQDCIKFVNLLLRSAEISEVRGRERDAAQVFAELRLKGAAEENVLIQHRRAIVQKFLLAQL